jgi:hypothetical protein
MEETLIPEPCSRRSQTESGLANLETRLDLFCDRDGRTERLHLGGIMRPSARRTWIHNRGVRSATRCKEETPYEMFSLPTFSSHLALVQMWGTSGQRPRIGRRVFHAHRIAQATIFRRVLLDENSIHQPKCGLSRGESLIMRQRAARNWIRLTVFLVCGSLNVLGSDKSHEAQWNLTNDCSRL